MTGIVHIHRDELLGLTRTALENVAVPPEDAAIASDILVTADMQGIDTHGTRRLGPYVESIRSGMMKARPDIQVDRKTPGVAVVDGNDGLGPVVGFKALNVAMDIARETGIAYVGVRNSNHFAAIAPYASIACERNMVSFIGSNSFATMPPWRGQEVRHGNNPLCIAAPRQGHPPFIIDIAMSIVARGRIRKHLEHGESIPAGWAMDPQGQPTTDPREALKGTVLPIGNHKGYGLAMAVDILAGVLTGGAFAMDVKSLFQQRDKPQRVSHFFILIDIPQVIGLDAYFERMEALCTLMKTSEPFDPDLPVLLPGEPEAMAIEENTKSGIPMNAAWIETVRTLAQGAERVSVPDY
jgi:ureidoglycolate dehydrogenase (NAD+)